MKRISTLLTVLILAATVKSQTATPFAQYAGNQMIFNPAFAGAHDLLSTNLSFRRLWTGVPGSPGLISFNAHAPFIDQRNSLGFVFQRETFGPQIINLVNVAYSYRLSTGAESSLSFGTQIGLFNSITDWGLVTYVRHREDPAYGRGQRLVTNSFDVNAGLYFRARSFYLGLSARHLTTPRLDEITVRDANTAITVYSHTPRQFFLIGGYNFRLNDNFDLRPRFLMRHKSGAPFTISGGMDAVYNNRFTFGANVMSGLPAVTLSVGIEVIEGLHLSYAFDMNFGIVRPFQRGSHEISISYFTHIWTNMSGRRALRHHFR